MDNTFIVAGIISIVFFLAKFCEMRFVDKESKPLKVLIRDSLVTYFSVVVGLFLVDQLKPLLENSSINTSAPVVFTDNPVF
jgi:hypothetical protein